MTERTVAEGHAATRTAAPAALPSGASVEWITLDDGWAVRGYHQPACPPAGQSARGALFWLGGRGDFFEKYLETLDHWAGQGWDVFSVDWRGQGGSGRTTADPHVGHIDDFSRWTRDLSQAFAQWRARTSGPHVMLGHSMGGHLLLRAIAEGGVTPDRAVLIAPMLGLDSPIPFWLGRRLARQIATRLGGQRRAWKGNERPGALRSRQDYLTHDDRRYQQETDWWQARPDLRLGPGSWGWMAAAYDSVAWLLEAGRLESISVPLLLMGTDGDGLVSPAAIRRFAARIPGAELVMYDREVAHEILRETDEHRDPALARIDAFLNVSDKASGTAHRQAVPRGGH